MIIAICGLKRSGKNTTGDYIVQNYGYKDYAFAKPIKEACSILFDWSLDYMEDHKEEIDERWGVSPRQALQYLGTEDFQYNFPSKYPLFKEKVGRAFWVKKFEYELEKNKNENYVITDFRFKHEHEILRKYNAVTIKIVNPNVEATDIHESEKYVNEVNTDLTLYNEGTKEDLYKQIDRIMSYIRTTREDWK